MSSSCSSPCHPRPPIICLPARRPTGVPCVFVKSPDAVRGSQSNHDLLPTSCCEHELQFSACPSAANHLPAFLPSNGRSLRLCELACRCALLAVPSTHDLMPSSCYDRELDLPVPCVAFFCGVGSQPADAARLVSTCQPSCQSGLHARVRQVPERCPTLHLPPAFVSGVARGLAEHLARRCLRGTEAVMESKLPSAVFRCQ